jgi:hypothetical protein
MNRSDLILLQSRSVSLGPFRQAVQIGKNHVQSQEDSCLEDRSNSRNGIGGLTITDRKMAASLNQATGGVGVARGCSWKNRANSPDASGPAGSV